MLRKTHKRMRKTLFLLFISLLNLTAAKCQQGWFYQNSNLTTNQYGAIYPVNKDTVFVFADNGLFLKTFNGGTTWFSQNTGFSQSFFDLSFLNSDTGYAVGQQGSIVRTIDGGTNWTLLSSGANKDLFSISTKNPNKIWVVGDSGVILHSLNYGASWIKNDTLTHKKLNSIGFRNSDTGFIAGNSGTLLETINGGLNWDTIATATTADLFSLSVTDHYAYMLAGSVSDYYYSGSWILKTDGILNWTLNSLSIPGPSDIYFQNDSSGFILTSEIIVKGPCIFEINKTSDYGQSWSVSFSDWYPPSGCFQPEYSDIHFINDSIGYVLNGNNILKTLDGGLLVSTQELPIINTGIILYPNPTIGLVNINFPPQFGYTGTLQIYNYLGQLQQTIELHTDIDISSYENGLYFIVAENDKGERISARVVKE